LDLINGSDVGDVTKGNGVRRFPGARHRLRRL